MIPSHTILSILKWVFRSIMSLVKKSDAKKRVVESGDETTLDVDIDQVDTPHTSMHSQQPTERLVAVGPYASVCDIVKSGYNRLVMCRAFDPERDIKTSEYILNPSVDGWNVVEATCLLAAHRLGALSAKTMASSVEHRVVLCACFCIVCKNAVDHEAFPPLRQSIYRETPLAFVYHIIFQQLVTTWSRSELDVTWLQRRVESAEGCIIVRENLYRLLNDTPTMRFEVDAFKRLRDSTGKTDLPTLSILRNVVSFYVLTALACADAELNGLVMARPTADLVGALACIAVHTIDVCEATGGPVLAVPDSIKNWVDSSKIAMRILDFALELSARDTAPRETSYPFDFDTITRVRTRMV